MPITRMGLISKYKYNWEHNKTLHKANVDYLFETIDFLVNGIDRATYDLDTQAPYDEVTEEIRMELVRLIKD